MLAETFVELVKDPSHWMFEIMLMIIFDVVIGMILWPFAKRWLKNHDAKKHAHRHCEDVHQSVFWTDLSEDLKDPEFLKAYIKESVQIAIIDQTMNEGNELF